MRFRTLFRSIIVLLAGALIVVAVGLYLHEHALEKPLVIAVIPKTTATDYWESMHAGILAAAHQHRITILWNAPQSEADYAAQAQMLEDAINRKVNAIVLAPAQEFVLASGVRHAKAVGIPVVIVDSPVAVPPDHYLAYIGSDDASIGRIAADRIGSILNGKGEAAIIAVSPTVASSTLRDQAFIAEISRYWPQIKIVDVQYGLSNPRRSQALTINLLAAHPHLKAIFAVDAFATRGAFAGLMDLHEQRRIRLVGVAQEVDMLDQVRSGNIDSLVVQDPYQMGYVAIQILEKQRKGTRRIQTRVLLATRGSVDTRAVRLLWSHYSDQSSEHP